MRRDANRGTKAIARVGVIVAAVLTAGAATAAADDLCGVTLVASLTLEHDLSCAGDGLIVGADGITVNLNGHTIAGAGGGSGVLASGRTGVLITGGTIRNFLIGVQLSGSTGITIKQIVVTGNRDGIFLIGSSGNTIKENTAWQNSRVGVMLRPGAIRNSTQNVVKENTLIENANGVILVETPIDNVLKENIISRSSRAGIALNGGVSGNLIQENTIGDNAAGILFNIGSTGLLPRANRLVENMITTNTCGLQGSTTGNTLTENLFQGNVVDMCP